MSIPTSRAGRDDLVVWARRRTIENYQYGQQNCCGVGREREGDTDETDLDSPYIEMSEASNEVLVNHLKGKS